MQSPITFALTLAMFALAPTSHAESAPPLADLHGREPIVPDLTPRPFLSLTSAQSGRATVSLAVSVAQRPERRDVAGSLMLTVPTSRLVAPTKAKVLSSPPEDSPEGDESMGDIDAGASKDLARAPRKENVALPLIRPRDARAAIAAAQRIDGHGRASERLDDLAARARWSALLPQVRLRATRLIDESNSLSPTSYDANRTTSSGGISLWLEARTTWNLDRLVFAQDEVPIERLRHKVRDGHSETARRILGLLFDWQRAVYAVVDPLAQPDLCPMAWIKAQQLAAELDVETGGWLTRWRQERGHEPVRCEDWEAIERP